MYFIIKGAVALRGSLIYIMGLKPVERRRRETKNHPLCGCATEVIQKNTFPVKWSCSSYQNTKEERCFQHG